MLFNINDDVYVKLTDYGRKIHREEHIKFWGKLPKLSHPTYDPPKEDSDGWSKWQMWSLMKEFGNHIGMGKPNVFDTTIKLE